MALKVVDFGDDFSGARPSPGTETMKLPGPLALFKIASLAGIAAAEDGRAPYFENTS
jgi:hypothetical protein